MCGMKFFCWNKFLQPGDWEPYELWMNSQSWLDDNLCKWCKNCFQFFIWNIANKYQFLTILFRWENDNFQMFASVYSICDTSSYTISNEKINNKAIEKFIDFERVPIKYFLNSLKLRFNI